MLNIKIYFNKNPIKKPTIKIVDFVANIKALREDETLFNIKKTLRNHQITINQQVR